MKAITLWQPHASLIFLPDGVLPKRIETRTHARFRSLAGQRIAIHSAARRVRQREVYALQRTICDIGYSELVRWLRVNLNLHCLPLGRVLGTAFVREFRELTERDERAALCRITENRFGLVLDEVLEFSTPIPAKGNRGIWNWTPPPAVFPYRWRWGTCGGKYPEVGLRKGMRCRVLARGRTMNTARIEFEDGFRTITSRNGLAKVKGGAACREASPSASTSAS